MDYSNIKKYLGEEWLEKQKDFINKKEWIDREVLKEKISNEPVYYFLEKIDNKDDFNYRWLILSSLDIKTLAKNKIDSMNTSGIAYLFEEYSISSVEKTSDSNLYILNIVVKVSSKQELNLNN